MGSLILTAIPYLERKVNYLHNLLFRINSQLLFNIQHFISEFSWIIIFISLWDHKVGRRKAIIIDITFKVFWKSVSRNINKFIMYIMMLTRILEAIDKKLIVWMHWNSWKRVLLTPLLFGWWAGGEPPLVAPILLYTLLESMALCCLLASR